MAPKSPAQDLLAKAEKKANSSGGWFSSSSTKFEEAGDLYQQAANSFKIEKGYREAGDAFAKEAECREQCGESNDAALAWWNAAKAYKSGLIPDLAIQALTQTITHLTKGGRFRQAADREKEIAMIYLRDLNDPRKACDSFERAGEWYDQEQARATASACFKDAADIHADLEEYTRAILLYEKVADYSSESPLTKHSVKEYCLRVILCTLASGDPVIARRKWTNYSNDTTFKSTREAKFAAVLIDAVEEGDKNKLTDAAHEFDQLSTLEPWKLDMLLKIKKGIQDEPGLL